MSAARNVPVCARMLGIGGWGQTRRTGREAPCFTKGYGVFFAVSGKLCLSVPSPPALLRHMNFKREERKQRSEADRVHREHAKRAQTMRNRFIFVAGVLIVAGVVWLAVNRRQQSGRVWSAEHGHWHDK